MICSTSVVPERGMPTTKIGVSSVIGLGLCLSKKPASNTVFIASNSARVLIGS